MENNSRLLFCSLFLFLLWEYASGAKKKKDLQTIVESTLENGQMFDSSLAKGREPLEFQLGKGKVIKGWEMGKTGMCIGEKRKLIIPPHLDYGSRGIQNVIPPNSVLIFTIELMSIKRKSLFDPKLLLQIGFWPVLAGVILYYLYRKASKESGKPEIKSSKKNKNK